MVQQRFGTTPAAAPQGNEQPAQVQPSNNTAESQQQQADPMEIIRRIAKEESAKTYQAMQSALGKQEARIKKLVEDQVTSLKAANVPVTPEVERAIDRTVRENISSPEPAVAPEPAYPTPSGNQTPGVKAQQAQQPSPADSVNMLINAEAEELVKQFGYDLDPKEDADLIDELRKAAESNIRPYAWLKKYEEALTKRGQRQAEKGSPARMPTMASGGTTVNIEELTKKLESMLAHPTPATMPEIRKLQEELSKLTRQ